MSIVLPPFTGSYQPVPQVTPLTYRDGVTMLKKLDDLKKYINKELVPFVNDNYQELADAFETNVNALIEQVNAALAAQDASVDQKIEDLTQYVDEQVAIIVGDAVQVQDSVVAGIFANAASATRAVTDALYATKAEIAAANVEIDTKADQTALDATNAQVALKANQTALDATNVQVATNTTDIADLDGRVDDVEAEFSSTVAGVTMEAIRVKRGGQYGIGLYTRLRDGIINPNLTTRVVVLGDSHANGGITTYPDMGMFQRLGHRCGSPEYRRVEDVVTGPPSGMMWWSGSIGGADTTDYYPSTYPPKLAILNPNYVIHLIGSNDWARNISISAYKANLTAVCAAIETQNPNAINVLVHGQQRRDTVPSSGLSWNAYGDAMAEVVAAAPSRRTYINTDELMKMLGLGTDNRAGLVVSDNIHLGNIGNKLMANLIGQEMGIPSENDYAPTCDNRRATFPGSATYNADTNIAEISIESANYPREVEVSGTIFATATHANSEIAMMLIKVSNGAQLDSWEQRFEETDGTSRTLSWTTYIPPYSATVLRFRVIVVGGTTVQVQGGGAFTQALARIRPL